MEHVEASYYLQTSLLAAMLGASIGFALQEGLQEPTVWTIVALVSVILHAVNFYHGKTMGLHDLGEVVRTDARPLVRSTNLLYNTLLFMTFCAMALLVDSAMGIAVAEISLRLLDIVGIGVQLRYWDKSPGVKAVTNELRDQLRYWQAMNCAALVVFGLAAVVIQGRSVVNEIAYPYVVMALLLLVSVDLIIEYGKYSGNYFRDLNDWNILAERWDRLQGCFGDRYRREILHPFVSGWIEAPTVVDLGCGNGCTARHLANSYGAQMLAIDRAGSLLELANLYDRSLYDGKGGTVQYFADDIDKGVPDADVSSRLKSPSPGGVDAIALFSAQDCQSMDAFFSYVDRLSPDRLRLLIVVESDHNFNPGSAHSSTIRSWKYSLRSENPQQIVSWMPVRDTEPSSLFAGEGEDWGGVISLVTHFRRREDLVASALALGFVEEDSGPIELLGRPCSPADLKYQKAPKFDFLYLVRPASDGHGGAPLPADAVGS